MPNTMSPEARQQFLADLHVGIISVSSPADRRGPLTVPVWYLYEAAVGVTIGTGRETRKGVALAAAGRYSLVVQAEELPYRYVSVEGPIVEVRTCEYERDLLPMAVRYLGAELGATYAEQLRPDLGAMDVYVMQPERWYAQDQTADWAALNG